ncbi:ABC transporter ATP-binding protein [Sedimenticola sp.]|uniref:ABC transporter ATP-binding protein n=1 Tax=Sedimenticola sp. TaxID=1940285 RepID=UPI003D0A84B8
MAKITLENIRHSYTADVEKSGDWALKEMDIVWSDGGAYALLGPSGCGKTTLLNIISGLLVPTEGRVLFNDRDVTDLASDQRHIAQVFQFPVVYDTMTVYENLAFPLRNRGMDSVKIKHRVHEIAQMLDLETVLDNRASGLTADGKQKISLGRGLVRDDVNVIMFDEPLTVIDPHLKWLLRSKLKRLHQQVGATMIYVTHDQTEALTFADKVVVMHEGVVVQVGTPVELFQKPNHTFVGHFIGSPGMNFLPCQLMDGIPTFDGNRIDVSGEFTVPDTAEKFEIGIRPEFIKIADQGLPVDIVKVDDVGRYRIVESRYKQHTIKLIVPEGVSIPVDKAKIQFEPSNTHLYADHWILT